MVPAPALLCFFWPLVNLINLSMPVSSPVKWRYTYSRTDHLWTVWDQVMGPFCSVPSLENSCEEAHRDAEQVVIFPWILLQLSRLDGFAARIVKVLHEGAECCTPKWSWRSWISWEACYDKGFRTRKQCLAFSQAHIKRRTVSPFLPL